MSRREMTPGPKAPVDADSFVQGMEEDVLARTLWGEARGEGEAGMRAVASVILNRVRVASERGGYWWGNTVIEVCLKPYQFSCWNKADPNYSQVLRVDQNDPAFARAQKIAQDAVRGFLQDRTGGATHYHTASIQPNWSAGADPTAQIGHHVFYRLEEASA